MDRYLRIEPGACLLGAMWLYLLPFRWVLGALTAGAVHEGCHLIALAMTGAPVYSVTLGGMGAKIDTGPLEPWQELLCALAGPTGSISLLLCCRVFPEAALWGLVQGLFNLLPLYPMDGGRALRCIMKESRCAIIEKMTVLFLLAGCLWASLVLRMGIGAWVPAIALAVGCRGKKNSLQTDKKSGTIR